MRFLNRRFTIRLLLIAGLSLGFLAALAATTATVDTSEIVIAATGAPLVVVETGPTDLERAQQAEASEWAELATAAEQKIEVLEEVNAQLRQTSIEQEQQIALATLRADRAELDGWTFEMQEQVFWTVFATLAPNADLDVGARVAQCESGGTISPHDAVSTSKDFGRLQINRKSWLTTFRQMFPGEEFETYVLRPEINARMAAFVWNDSGSWGPWACWYITRGVPVPW